MRAATLATVYVALFAAHQVADHWVQTDAQALNKGAPGWPGRLAAGRHVVVYTLVAVGALALIGWHLGLLLDPGRVALGLAVNAVTHWWADRRSTLARLAERFGHGRMWMLAPPLGGAYLLDQAWHYGWLFVTALVIA